MKKLIFLFCLTTAMSCNHRADDDAVKPWSQNQWYWQFKGNPVMLLGASNDDNLFQWPSQKLIPHLDSMKTIGANYVRNTMSDRKDKGFELYPYKQLDSGKYDLDQWNEEYWQRFDSFLRETEKRDIIVQIEIWDRFDYSNVNWPCNPYNPQNNKNYTAEESGLDMDYSEHPGQNKQPFFFTTPDQQNNTVLLQYQQKFVEKLLSCSLNYKHILYCMDNETSGEEKWGAYWARFIKERAGKAGKNVYVTEMWDAWNLKSDQHKRTFDHPELYDFSDISQNSHQRDQTHWDNLRWVKSYLSAQPRPVNTVKTYGADGGRHGNTNNAIDNWWRHIIGGVASARFHRPASGLGLSEISMNSVKAAREIEKMVPFWELLPDTTLLSSRENNEAYLVAKKGEAFVIFFPDKGEVELNLTGFDSEYFLKWMNVRKGEWSKEVKINGGRNLTFTTPDSLEWVAIVYKN